MTSQTSNPFSTGGGGQFFEAKVQASFVLHLLIGGRVQALIKMREEQPSWRRQAGSVKIRIREAESTGKLVIEAVLAEADFEITSPLKLRNDKQGESRIIQERRLVISQTAWAEIRDPA